MARTHATFLTQAQALKSGLKELQDLWLLKLRKLVQTHNGAPYTDAGDATKPAYLNEDAAGNIDGTAFSRADYVAGITLLNELEDFFTNGPVTQGDYKTTISKVVGA